MLPVEGQDGAPFRGGVRQDIRIADAHPRHPRFLDRHDVVTEDSGVLRRREGGSSHPRRAWPPLRPPRSRGSAGRSHRGAADISPGVRQVLGAERGIAPEQLRLADPQASRLLEHPDRNPRPHDARLSAADPGPALDPRGGVAQVPHDPLKELRLSAGPRLSNCFSISCRVLMVHLGVRSPLYPGTPLAVRTVSDRPRLGPGLARSDRRPPDLSSAVAIR